MDATARALFQNLPEEGTQPASKTLLFAHDQQISWGKISINLILSWQILSSITPNDLPSGLQLHTLQLLRSKGQ